jgi:hypothetical protein
MDRGYLDKWKEHQDSFFFSLKLTRHTYDGHRGPWGVRLSSRGGGGVGIYRPEKLRALPTPLKSSGHPVLFGRTPGTIYSLVQRVSRTCCN